MGEEVRSMLCIRYWSPTATRSTQSTATILNLHYSSTDLGSSCLRWSTCQRYRWWFKPRCRRKLLSWAWTVMWPKQYNNGLVNTIANSHKWGQGMWVATAHTVVLAQGARGWAAVHVAPASTTPALKWHKNHSLLWRNPSEATPACHVRTPLKTQ